VILNQIEYKLEYDVVKNCLLFNVLLFCLCNSIDGCVFKTDHQETPVMIRTNTSAEDKTHFGFLLQQFPYLLLSLEFSQWVIVNTLHPLSAKP